jgi:hypothetical protein
MNVAVVGARKGFPPAIVGMLVSQLPPDTVIVSGGADGVDICAEAAAGALRLKTHIFYPDYRTLPGSIAPLERNSLIAEKCDEMIACVMPQSSGTWDAIRKTRKLGKRVTVYDNEGQILESK